MKIFAAIMLVSTMTLAKSDIILKPGNNYNSENDVAQTFYMQQQQQQQNIPQQQQQPEFNNQNTITASYLKPNIQLITQTQNQPPTQNHQQLQLPHSQGNDAPPKQQQQPQQLFLTKYPMPNDFPSKFYFQPALKTVQRYRPRVRIPKKAIVTKNFYIHSAPEETQAEIEEELAALQEQPRKHYNVLFVKTPSQTNKAAALNLARALKEEKTVVYVLAKKTTAADLEEAVQESHQHDTKPEVFFINYRTPEEADNAQRQIQAQYDTLGGSTNISDEGIAPATSVIGTLVVPDDLKEEEDNHQQHPAEEAPEPVQLSGHYDEPQLADQLPSPSSYGYLPPSQQY